MDQYRVVREVPLPYALDDNNDDMNDEDGEEEGDIKGTARQWLSLRRRRPTLHPDVVEGNEVS